jgi:hypothetical protein
MPQRTALTALTVLVALAGRTAAADATQPAAVAHVLICRWVPDGEAPAADPTRSAYLEDYLATHRELIRSSEIATRAARSKRLQGIPGVAGADGAFAIVRALKVEREATGIRDSLTVTASGVAPEVGVAVLEAVLESYQDFLQETYKVPQPGQRSRGGYAMAVLAKPASVKK